MDGNAIKKIFDYYNNIKFCRLVYLFIIDIFNYYIKNIIHEENSLLNISDSCFFLQEYFYIFYSFKFFKILKFFGKLSKNKL